jgi:hypothetical protein
MSFQTAISSLLKVVAAASLVAAATVSMAREPIEPHWPRPCDGKYVSRCDTAPCHDRVEIPEDIYPCPCPNPRPCFGVE